MSGYDQFFKEASKASGLSSGKPAPKKAGGASSSQKKPKFNLKESKIGSGTAEDRLRQEMMNRSRTRRSASLRKRQNFPVLPAIIALIAIISCTVGFLKPDLADQILSHIEISAFGKANAAGKSDTKSDAKAANKKDEPAKSAETKATSALDAAKLAAGGEQAKTEVPPDFRTWSDEELSFFNKLNDRKKELDLREAELNKLDEELQKQKAELDSKIKQLEAMRGDISKTLKSRVEVDQAKVDKLVQFYSTMKPQQAAKVIESINEDLAVEVMDKMKKKNAAEIMDALKPEKARRLSELLTGYQRSPASDATDESDGSKN